MAPDPDYEPSIAPAAFAAGWRAKFKSHPRLSVVAPSDRSDDDCPFEYEELLRNGEGHLTTDELYHEPQDDSGWAMGSPARCMPAMPRVGDWQHSSSNASIALVGTNIKKYVPRHQIKTRELSRYSLDIQMQSVLHLL